MYAFRVSSDKFQEPVVSRKRRSMVWNWILLDSRSDDIEQGNEQNLNQLEDLYEETASNIRW
jgi:hypothetical protein